MLNRHLPCRLVLILVLLSPVRAVVAADLVQLLPHDTLAFVVVKNLSATDAKVQRLLATIESTLPGPLEFLHAATGVSEGIDHDGDAMFAMLPGGSGANQPLIFAIWVPVQNYDAFVTKLGGAAEQQITGATVANEDVLVARHGQWALIMDPDQRVRIAQILAVQPGQPSPIATWSSWIESNDITAVAMPLGLRALLHWAASARPLTPNAAEDPFGFGQDEEPNDAIGTSNDAVGSHQLTALLRATLRDWFASSPLLTRSLIQSNLIGAALRFDDDTNLHGGVRILSKNPRAWTTTSNEPTLPPTLYEGGSFVLHGSGRLQHPILPIVAGAYVNRLVKQLATDEGVVFDKKAVAQFQQVVERAAAQVESAAVLTQPGDKKDGIYTNDFAVVRAASAQSFADNAKEVMRLWNVINRDAQAGARLIFDVDDLKVGERTATQYSLDIAAADGAPELPEIRQVMEQLFGKGGKLRLWIVPVDDYHVLLASATQDQVVAALAVLDRQQSVDWNRDETSPINRLLPDASDWRLFASPHHYNVWYRRQMEAITGPVIGGPIVKDFPPSPPIGFAGGVRDGELWIDFAASPATIKAGTVYLNNKQR